MANNTNKRVSSSKIKSTKTLGYNLTGILDKENLVVIELLEDDEIIHDLNSLLEPFDGEEIKISFSHKVKLEDGVE